MPSKPTLDMPSGLKPYNFHRVSISSNWGSEEVPADCPLCGKEGKFSINQKSAQWRCFVCHEQGNQYTFLTRLYELSKEETLDKDYQELAEDRNLSAETIESWGLVRSILTDEWLFPAYNSDKKLTQLYRYAKTVKGKALLATPECGGLKMFGLDLYDIKKSVVYLCEGPWDGMKLYEVLKNFKEEEGRIVEVNGSKRSKSLYSSANVIAVPGCGSFQESWLRSFPNKKVYVVFDSDHPRKHPKTGTEIEPTGLAGVKRLAEVVASSKLKKPKELKYCKWGIRGYDPKLPNGYDLRDHFGSRENWKDSLKRLRNKFQEVPKDWMVTKLERHSEDSKVVPIKCNDWQELQESWEAALTWTEGLDIALSCMLASIASVEVAGDQLWMKILGPPACGKSTLCEAISVAEQYVLAKSTLRGFVSGFKGEGENSSLAERLINMTFVTKDGDTLLQSPNYQQILAEGRDLYDRVTRTDYRNEQGKDFVGINMTWLLCGTGSLKSIDESELGERFLDCVIVDRIDEDQEEEILRSIISEACEVSIDDVGSAESPELKRAMGLTGGYVNYLRENVLKLIPEVKVSKKAQIKLAHYSKFIACMRARPSKRQKEKAERELAFRLGKQLTKLARCLAVVLQTDEVDEETLYRVLKVTFDTAQGTALELAGIIYDYGKEGADTKTLKASSTLTDVECIVLLKYMREIEVLQFKKVRINNVLRQRWFLTDRFGKLYEEVVNHD